MKLLKLGLWVIVCLCLTQTLLFGEVKVLFIVRETSQDMNYMISHEVGPMLEMLKDAGYEADIATETGTILGTGESILHPNIRLSDVDVNNYIGVIIPCMADPPPFHVPKFSLEIVKTMYAKGLPIAAQMSGVYILAKAGILENKKFAAAVGVYETKGTNIYYGVVQDGQIITSGICPQLARIYGRKDGTRELMTGFLEMLKNPSYINMK
jgi:putative intracellular protease/amidase